MTRGTGSARCLPLLVGERCEMDEVVLRLLTLARSWDERAHAQVHAPSREVYLLFASVLERTVDDATMLGLDTDFVLRQSWQIIHDLESPVNTRVRERLEDLYPTYLVLRKELETELDAPRHHR